MPPDVVPPVVPPCCRLSGRWVSLGAAPGPAWALRSGTVPAVLVLLPPSEGKTAPVTGTPVDIARLSHPELNGHRAAVLTALAKVSAHPDALATLGVGPRLAGEVAANTRLIEAPAARAAEVYTGVLYAAAGLAGLEGRARADAERRVRIVSALWGVLTPQDVIPAYRLSMGTALPGVGPLARSWRPHLAGALDDVGRDRLVVDCRSAAYAAAWSPGVGGPGWVSVRVVDSAGKVVSHHAKHTRGVLTRHLVTRAGAEPASVGDLVAAAAELAGQGGSLAGVEWSEVARGRGTLTLRLP